MRTSYVLCGLLMVGALLAASPARADDDGKRAGELYDKGASAEDRGDFADAARLFSQADQLAPNPVALEAALRAATAADNAVLAMELADKAEDRSPGTSLAKAIEATRTAFGERVGRMKILCNGCTAKLDGDGTPLNKMRYVPAGGHVVEFDFPGRKERQLVKVTPGKNFRVSPKTDGSPSAQVDRADDGIALAPKRAAAEASDAPSAAETPPDDAPPITAEKDKAPTPSSGMSPAWFVGGCVITAALAGVTIASGVDTLHRHSEFDREPTQANQDAGRAADIRTQILGGATGLALAGTVVVGAVFVHWKDHEPAKDARARRSVLAAVAPSPLFLPRGGGVAIDGAF